MLTSLEHALSSCVLAAEQRSLNPEDAQTTSSCWREGHNLCALSTTQSRPPRSSDPNDPGAQAATARSWPRVDPPPSDLHREPAAPRPLAIRPSTPSRGSHPSL